MGRVGTGTTERGTVQGSDKDERSVRFSLVTSIASSWVIAVTAAGVGELLGSPLLTYQVPLWLVLLLGLIGFSIVGATLQSRRKDQRGKKNDQVFFIVSAFNEQRWIAELLRDLLSSLDRRGFDLVLKAPERDYIHHGQVRHLRKLSGRHDRYVGGIIMPTEPDLLRHKLRTFCTSAGYPVIITDIDPFGAAEDYPADTAFVGYSPEAIGRCAADYVAEHARRSQISSPSVLVIGSDLHIGRQEEFIRQLELRLQDVEFIRNDNGKFNRACARKIAYENLRPDRHATPNYIYCTNDEMALGAVDALSSMGHRNDGSVVVVGVDGIPEARALIDSQTPLRATVVQDSCRMAEIATDLLDRAIRGERVETYNYLDPQIYSRDR